MKMLQGKSFCKLFIYFVKKEQFVNFFSNKARPQRRYLSTINGGRSYNFPAARGCDFLPVKKILRSQCPQHLACARAAATKVFVCSPPSN